MSPPAWAIDNGIRVENIRGRGGQREGDKHMNQHSESGNSPPSTARVRRRRASRRASPGIQDRSRRPAKAIMDRY